MTPNEDIRWEQRLSNYRKALNQLSKFIDKGELSELEEQGLIKAFEYNYELAWNLLKDYLEFQGISNIIGSRDTFKEALSANLINSGDAWMSMIRSRNQTSHSYNQDTAEEISESIKSSYYFLFKQLEVKMESLRSGAQNKFF